MTFRNLRFSNNFSQQKALNPLMVHVSLIGSIFNLTNLCGKIVDNFLTRSNKGWTMALLMQEPDTIWQQFLECVRGQCSDTAFGNWLKPIKVRSIDDDKAILEVPNIFVKEYLISNYREELCAFLPVDTSGSPVIEFVIAAPKPKLVQPSQPVISVKSDSKDHCNISKVKLNSHYQFSSFVEGPSNQFVKSAALGVATRPGQSYNPLFMHGGVGLGKTHLLHAIGHHIIENNKKLTVQCITTEALINEIVSNLKNKSIDKWKQFYRFDVDVLLVDDIQFLQSRLNFEEEFCLMFESLIHQKKQIVIACDKPPSQLNLSARLIDRMEWGLVAHVSPPELETRVAILEQKAELKGLEIAQDVAFFIAEHISNNVRQLEGAMNRLIAHSRLLNHEITIELVEKTLHEMLSQMPQKKVTIEEILKTVSKVFQVRVSELKGSKRTKNVALPRQVAMYLAKELIHESLIGIGDSFNKTHSTIIHACKRIADQLKNDDTLRRQVDMIRRNLNMSA